MNDSASPSLASERYTIRRKVFKLFGAGFHIYGSDGELVGYCKQKAFKLKEDLRICTDESLSQELMRITTPNVIDFSAMYQVHLSPDGHIGSYRRHGGKSFLRDTWSVLDSEGTTIAQIREDSAVKALLRRLHGVFALFIPQTYMLDTTDGRPIARYRTHANPFVYRLSVTILQEDEVLDDLLILAGGCLLSAIEGRQRG